jgi:type IX secretion system PorP/SprF family membrane protein
MPVLGWTQSLPQFSQYIFNQFYLNPGSAGISNKAQVQASGRSQYTGYIADSDPGGSSFTTIFSADLPMQKLKGGVGIYLSNNTFSSIQSKQELQISYSFHKRFNNSIFGAGFSVGNNTLKLFGENYRPRDLEDPLIPSNNININNFDLNAGVFVQNPIYQAGISVKNILKPVYSITNEGEGYTDTRQYILSGKYDLGVTYTLDISPMFIIKSDLKNHSTELGVITTYNQWIWGGFNYRWQDAVSAMIGANVLKSNLKLGYSIDFVSFGTIAKSSTSHEFFVRYMLSVPKFGKKSIVRTPRYSF